MKNKGLIITLIILLTIVVFFLIMFLVSYLRGKIGFGSEIFGIGKKSKQIMVRETFALEEIKKIDILQEAGDIIFKETQNDTIEVEVYGENKEDIEVSLRQGDLTIDNRNQKHFIFFHWGGQNDIIVYLPSSYTNEISIENNCGNCELIDLEKASATIDCDAGNVKLGKIKNATIKCDLGNVEIKEILNQCNIKSNCGNVEISSLTLQEDSMIECDLGNVTIGKTNHIYIDAKVDLGNCNINENDRNAHVTLTIDCDCGNIDVNH